MSRGSQHSVPRPVPHAPPRDAADALLDLLFSYVHTRSFHPGPFMVAIAMSANIGSAATLIGNPQNAIIASVSGVSFTTFLFYSAIAMVVSIVVNTFALQLWFRRELSINGRGNGATVGDADAEEGTAVSVNAGPGETTSLLSRPQGVPRVTPALTDLTNSRFKRHQSLDEWKEDFERQFSSLRRATVTNLDGLRRASVALQEKSIDKWEAHFEGQAESFRRESLAGYQRVRTASAASVGHRKSLHFEVVDTFPDLDEDDEQGESPRSFPDAKRRGSVATNICCSGGFHTSLKQRLFRYGLPESVFHVADYIQPCVHVWCTCLGLFSWLHGGPKSKKQPKKTQQQHTTQHNSKHRSGLMHATHMWTGLPLGTACCSRSWPPLLGFAQTFTSELAGRRAVTPSPTQHSTRAPAVKLAVDACPMSPLQLLVTHSLLGFIVCSKFG